MKLNKRFIVSLLAVVMAAASLTAPATASYGDKDLTGSEQLWQAVAFGQSTDMDFSSTILPEKVGTNYVYRYDSQMNLADSEPLLTQEPGAVQDVAIEARGGKISAAHDGLTFYYTEIPTDKNFILTGTVRVEQMGPEAAAPNLQEGAGLMVRDVIGGRRQEPLMEGYEEYPAASNMAAIWIDAAAKSINSDLTIKYLARYGVDAKEGTATSVQKSGDVEWLKGLGIAKAIYSNAASSIPDANLAGLTQSNRYDAEMILQLERTDESFIMRMLDDEGAILKEIRFKDKNSHINSNIVENIEPDVMYAGFFASRNARMSVKDIQLTLTDANTVNYPQYVAENTEKAVIYQASGDYVNSADYTIQALTNYDGTMTVFQDDAVIAADLAVTGGQQFTYPVIIDNQSSKFKLLFTAADDIKTTGVIEKLL